MEQSGLTRWGVDELAVLYTLYVCHFALSTIAHATGTPTPGRIGGLLFKPINFYLNAFKIWFACAISSRSLVLTPFFGFFVYTYV